MNLIFIFCMVFFNSFSPYFSSIYPSKPLYTDIEGQYDENAGNTVAKNNTSIQNTYYSSVKTDSIWEGFETEHFFKVEGCIGDLVFRTKGFSLVESDAVQVSIKIGKNAPERQLKYRLKNTPDNYVAVTEGYQEGFRSLVEIYIERDSLFLAVNLYDLNETSVFTFGEIDVTVEYPDVTRINCLANSDTLWLDPMTGEMGLSLMLHNRSEEKTLQIRALEFFSDESISEIIEDVQFKIGDSQLFTPTSYTPSKIRFYNRDGLLLVSPQDSVKLELLLKPHTYLFEEDRIIRLYLNDQSFEYIGSGEVIAKNGIPTLPYIAGRVNATGTKILNYSYCWNEGAFVTVANVDDRNNIDLKSVSDYRVKIIGRDGQVNNEISRQLTGMEQISLNLPEKENYVVVLEDRDSITVYGVGEQQIYREDFNAPPIGWAGNEHWKIEEGRWRHAHENTAGTSYFMKQFQIRDGKNTNFVWQTTIGNGDWQTSSVNYFRYYLLSDSVSTNHKKAIYFTVSSNSKRPLLLRDINGKRDTIWHGGRIWQEDQVYSVKILYDHKGYWEVSMSKNEHTPLLIDKVYAQLPEVFYAGDFYSGMLFRHGSASRGGKMWMDNMSFVSFAGRLATADYELLEGEGIRLYYAFPLDENEAAAADNYRLYRNNQQIYPDRIALQGDSSVVLYSHLLPGDYVLEISAFKNAYGEWTTAEQITFSYYPDPQEKDILINELLFHADPSTAEYIELYNASDVPVLLNTLWIAKKNAAGEAYEKKRITDVPVVFEAQSLVWVCYEPDRITMKYQHHNADNYFMTKSSLGYADGGGRVIVLNNGNAILDELEFDASLHHSGIKVTKGVALERINHDPGVPPALAWTSAGGDEETGFGSPGMPNRAGKATESILLRSTTDMTLFREPEVFTPDGDGYEDEVEIMISVLDKEFSVSAFVYDAKGQLVKQLAKGIPVYSATTYHWDGRNGKGELMPAGIYVIYAEVQQTDGKHNILRQSCVLSR